ncbi:hypothetical protein R3P38DRAFT_2830727 [Favolaschia claudopus]|uniref:Protein FAF1 n=1 Tax=Favolaschia claudopus TaxID=2862362 RepID=A0AAW0EAZ0_9AGAR
MSSDQHLLQILNAHGQDFLNSFALPASALGTKRKSTEGSSRPAKVPKLQPESDDDEEEEEWTGIQAESSESGDESEPGSDFEQEDDEFTSAPSSSKVVVFSEVRRPGNSDLQSLAQKKAFMSSKVSKLRDEVSGQKLDSSTPDDDEEEKTNIQNDALLHRLVHTKLLSGSLNEDLNMTPAQRKKALAGRVLEISGQAKLGKGEKSVREQERNKAGKRVREGMVDKQKERHKQHVEEAKNLGNYHPTIKKLFESTGTSNAPRRNRERGLKMGVGKFSGGMLKLSNEEITRAQGGATSTRGRGRGRGRGHGGNSRGRH